MFILMSILGSASTALADFNLKLHGKVGSFKMTSPTDGIPRTILYYFPWSIGNVARGNFPQKTLVFLHGGGSTTATDEGATKVARKYISDFTAYAEDEQIILLFPTTSFGWNAHTSHFMKYFLDYAKSVLAIDDQKIVLAGHSMGGMGITREAPWMTDLFLGIFGMSAGTQAHMLSDDALLPYLNGTPYVQMNGNVDHFTEFKPRMLAMQTALRKVEAKYGHRSKFRLIFQPGGHAYDQDQMFEELDDLYRNAKKNNYPKFFEINFGVIHYLGDLAHYSANPKIDSIVDEHFWVKLPKLSQLDPGPGKSVGMFLMGEVKGQTITFQSKQNTLFPRELELNLSSSLVRMDQVVRVLYDSKLVFEGLPPSTGPLKIKL